MSTMLLALMMQYVVSAKAGLINHVEGFTNVRANQIVQEMAPIRSGPNSSVEILLTPGSYLRLGAQSEAVIENADIAHVKVRIVSGQAIIEVVELSSKFPILVTSAKTQVELTETGLFRFTDGTVAIIEGKLKTVGDVATTYKKGWEVSYSTNYRASKISNLQFTSLDMFSRKRSEMLANASASLIATVQRASYSPYNPFWLYSPGFGAMVYIPLRDIRTPYGYRYYGLGFPSNGGRTTQTANGNTNNNQTPQANGNSNNPGGGNFSSGGERTFSTPGGGERQTVGEYQERKNPSVPAGPPTP